MEDRRDRVKPYGHRIGPYLHLHAARSLTSFGVEEFLMIFIKFRYLQHICKSF